MQHRQIHFDLRQRLWNSFTIDHRSRKKINPVVFFIYFLQLLQKYTWCQELHWIVHSASIDIEYWHCTLVLCFGIAVLL